MSCELNVQRYLMQYGINALITNYSIVAKEYIDEDLIVLNYDQINSPKNDPITNECRGLVLNRTSFEVISRSFDRFFNYGECYSDNKVNFTRCTVHEKIDGSLIRIAFFNGKWRVGTRGTAFAESGVNGWDITFEQLTYKALGFQPGDEDGFNRWCSDILDQDCTYICEVVSSENRVVTKYESPAVYLLAIRHNQTGDFKEIKASLFLNRFEFPRQFYFNSVEHCLEAVKALPNLEEGYVIYDSLRIPVCKIKSPVYVAAHLLRGEGLTPKRIVQLVLMNEVDEYLSVYPEDKAHFEPVLEKYNSLIADIQNVWIDTLSISDRKEFALRVKDYPFSAILFQAKNSGQVQPNFVELFHKQTLAAQLRVLEKYGCVCGEN